MQEISSISAVPLKTIGKVQRMLCESLNVTLKRIKPRSLVSRMANMLHLPSIMIEFCRQTCCAVEDSLLTESISANVVAASCIYLTVTAHNCLINGVNNICVDSAIHSSGLKGAVALDLKFLSECAFTTVPLIQRCVNILAPVASTLVPARMTEAMVEQIRWKEKSSNLKSNLDISLEENTIQSKRTKLSS